MFTKLYIEALEWKDEVSNTWIDISRDKNRLTRYAYNWYAAMSELEDSFDHARKVCNTARTLRYSQEKVLMRMLCPSCGSEYAETARNGDYIISCVNCHMKATGLASEHGVVKSE